MISYFVLLFNYYFFFVFQAEDGIRDLYLTGVQTCALPICGRPHTRAVHRVSPYDTVAPATVQAPVQDPVPVPAAAELRARVWESVMELDEATTVATRSEERRVGKECRSRGAAGDEKKRRGE